MAKRSAIGASVVTMLTVVLAGCGERYDLGPASFSISPDGNLQIVVCERFELTTVNSYVHIGQDGVNLVDFESETPIVVAAGDDILEAVESQAGVTVDRNIDDLLGRADYIDIYVEGLADGSDRSWTAGIRGPFVVGDDVWLKPNGTVQDAPCP